MSATSVASPVASAKGKYVANADVRTTKGKYEYPSCKDCHQGWEWPRNLRLMQVHPAARAVHPRTKSTIVPYLGHNPSTGAPLMPPNLFTQLHFVFSRKFRHQSLVFSFHWDSQTGQIFYDPPEERREGISYARLITLNSWWRELARCILHIIVQFGDLTSNTLFMADTFDDPVLVKYSAYSLMLSFVWMGFIGFWMISANREARMEWKMQTHPNIGNITLLPGRLDEWMSYFALTFFIFLGLDGMIRDIPTYLHPWKGIQPYAAIKNQGTRAYVVCFPDENHFKMENWCGQFTILPLRFMMTMLLFLYKLFILFAEWDLSTPRYLLWTTLATSMCTLVFNVRKWASLFQARGTWLRKKKQTRINDTKPKVDTGWREAAMEKRNFSGGVCSCFKAMCSILLAPLFFFSSREPSKPVDKGCCVCCGRPQDDLSRMERRLKTVPPDVDTLVMLTPDFKDFSDARNGVLKESDLGKVIKKAEFIDGYGSRVLVKIVRASEPDEALGQLAEFADTWWYDACALRKATAEEAFIGQHKGQDPDDIMRRIHKLASQLRVTGREITEELNNIENEADHQRACELVARAFADSVDASVVAGASTEFDRVMLGHTNSDGSPKAQATPKVARQQSPDTDSEGTGLAQELHETVSEHSQPLTPREAALRKALAKATAASVEDASAPQIDIEGLRFKAFSTLGKKSIGLAFLGGLTIHKPDTVEMLKHLASNLCSRDVLRLNFSILTASNQGVEQRVTDSCSKDFPIVNLVQFNNSVQSRKGVDLEAGPNYVALRQALTELAEIYIVVEGEKEVAQDAVHVYQRGAKVIPVSKYGGAAAGETNIFPLEALKQPSWANAEDWDALSNSLQPKRTAAAVANLLEQALRAL